MMKIKFWSQIPALLTEPAWNFDPDQGFDCLSNSVMHFFPFLCSDFLLVMQIDLQLSPTSEFENSRDGSIMWFWQAVDQIVKSKQIVGGDDQNSQIWYWQEMMGQTQARGLANSITMEKFHRHWNLMTPSWLLSDCWNPSVLNVEPLFNIFQAGAVCCQLTDNNGLYLRFIGTLNRHRRSAFSPSKSP